MQINYRALILLVLVNISCLLSATLAAPTGAPINAQLRVLDTSPGLGSINSGELKAQIGIATPVAKNLPALSIRYNSSSTASRHLGRGWHLALPFLRVAPDGSRYYFNGLTFEKLVSVGGVGNYRSRFDQEFKETSGSGFSRALPNGITYRFEHPVSSAQGTEWRLSAVEDRFGWRTSYLYSPTVLGGEIPYQISVDSHQGGLAEFVVEMIPNGANTHLSVIRVRSSSGVLIRRYTFEYDPIVGVPQAGDPLLLKSVTERGKASYLVGAFSMSYYPSGAFVDRMKEIVNPFGGRLKTNYRLQSVVNQGNGAIHSVAVVQSMVADAGIGETQTTTLEYQGGLVNSSGFLGFDRVIQRFPSGQSELRDFYLGVNKTHEDLPVRRGLLHGREVKDSAGQLVEKWNYTFSTSAALDRTVQSLKVGTIFGPGQAVKASYADESVYDFTNSRLEKIVSYGEIGSFDAASGIVSDTVPDDNLETLIEYRADIVGAPVTDLVQSVQVKAGNGTKIKETKYSYDATSGILNALERWINTDNSYQRFVLNYDSRGNLYEVKSPTDVTTTAQYTGFRIDSFTVDPGNYNFTADFDYDPDWKTISAFTPASGITTKLELDNAGRIAEARLESGPQARVLHSWNYAINGVTGGIPNNVVTTTEAGIEAKLYYDGFGRLVQSRDETTGGYRVQDYDFNAYGLDRKSNLYFDPSPLYSAPVLSTHSHSYDYDSAARLSGIVPGQSGDGDGIVTLQHDLAGDPRGSLALDPLSKPEYELHSGSNLTSGAGSGAESVVVNVFGDLPNSALNLIDLSSNVSSTVTDSLGRLVSLSPLTKTALNFTYKRNGYLEKIEDALGDKSLRNVDALGRLINQASTSEDREAFYANYYYDTPSRVGFYIPRGYLSLIDGTYDSVEFSYTALGDIEVMLQRVKSSGDEYLFVFSYDTFGNVADLIYPNGLVVSTEYDSQGLEKRVYSDDLSGSFANGVVSDITTRNANGNIVDRLWGNGVSERITYSASSGALKNFEVRRGAQVIYSSISQYDDWNLESVTESTQLQTQQTEFTFDAMNRLKHVAVDDSLSGHTAFDINRDSLGRIVYDSFRAPGYTWLYQNSLLPYQPSALRFGAQSYPQLFNANKQLTNSFGRSFSYDAARNLRSVRLNDGRELQIERSVLGNIVRSLEDRMGGVSVEVLHLGSGLYEIEDDHLSSTVRHRANIKGETSRGGVGTLAVINYDLPRSSSLSAGSSQFGAGIAAAMETSTQPGDDDDDDGPVCGNHILEAGEECDDGNTDNLDGCSSTCKWEIRIPGTLPPNYPLPAPPPPPPVAPPASGVTPQTGPCGRASTDQAGNLVNSNLSSSSEKKDECDDVTDKKYDDYDVKEKGPCDEITDLRIELTWEFEPDGFKLPSGFIVWGTLSGPDGSEEVPLTVSFMHGEYNTSIHFDGSTGEIVGGSTMGPGYDSAPVPPDSELDSMPPEYLEFLATSPEVKDYFDMLQYMQVQQELDLMSCRRSLYPGRHMLYAAAPVGVPLAGATAATATFFTPMPDELILLGSLNLLGRAASAAVSTYRASRVCSRVELWLRARRARYALPGNFRKGDICFGLNGRYNDPAFCGAARTIPQTAFQGFSPRVSDRLLDWRGKYEALRARVGGYRVRFNLDGMDPVGTFSPRWIGSLTSRELIHVSGRYNNVTYYVKGKPYVCFDDAYKAWTASQ